MVKLEWAFVVDVAQQVGVPESQCEDVAIEVFLRLERHFDSMASSDPPVIRAWLRTTTLHVAQEQSSLRATRPAGPAGPADPDLLDPETIVPTPEEQLMAMQTQGSLRALVDALEANRREVFLAHVIEEEPMTLVARRLGIPEATAYNRLRLAREDLREAIQRTWKTDDRKPGGRSFGVLPFFLAWRPDALERCARAAHSAAEALSQCVSAAAIAGGTALVTGAVITPGIPPSDVAAPAPPTGTCAPSPPPAAEPPRHPLQSFAPRPANETAHSTPREARPPAPRKHARYRPQVLLALAISALHRGDRQEAAAALQYYRDEYPDDPLADVHGEVQSALQGRSR